MQLPHVLLALLFLCGACSTSSSAPARGADAAASDAPSGNSAPHADSGSRTDAGAPDGTTIPPDASAQCSVDNTYCGADGMEGLCCAGQCILTLDPNNCG